MACPRILVVEDETLIALDIRNQLAEIGYDQVTTVRSAAKALEFVEKTPPDLALLDIHIEGPMDGVELGQELRDRAGTPIVYMTAYADPNTINRAVNTVPYGYLVKPVDERELHSTVQTALHKSKIEKEHAEAERKTRELQFQLLRSQKMDAIGKLTANIAHELNNTLLIIMGNIGLARVHSPGGEKIDARLGVAEEGCGRAAKLIRQLLGFSRRGVYRPELLVLSEAVAGAIDFLSQVVEKGVRIRVAPCSEELTVSFDREQLTQVITNLVLNAQEAMPQGGVINLELSVATVDSPEINNPDAEGHEYACLTISDEGGGIGEQHLPHIFEPFYTTKSKAQGVGLGLSVVYGILQRHGGWIELKTSGVSGTAFSLFFPRLAKQRSHAAMVSRDEIEEEPSCSGTILVLDDEELIVELLSDHLRNRGFSPVGFVSPNEALAWYERHFSRVDAILLDIKMPLMSGVVCFEKITEINPRARVLLFSGYAQDENVEHLLECGALGFFQKPIDFEKLLEKLTEVSRQYFSAL